MTNDKKPHNRKAETTMTRAIKALILIAVVFSSVATFRNAYAYDDYTNVPIHMGNYDGESETYTGFILFEDNTALPIAFQNIDSKRSEDDVYTTSTGVFTVDMALNNDSTWGSEFNHNNHTFNWWRLTVNDTTISDVTPASPMAHAGAKINGYLAQVTGTITNGMAIMLKDAGDPASCTVTCTGYMVQDDYLISFVYCDREDVTPIKYTIYLPIVVSSAPITATLSSVRIHHFADGSTAYYAMLHKNATTTRITITMNDNRPHNGNVESLTDTSFIQNGVSYTYIVRP